jgi:hypothetical protein
MKKIIIPFNGASFSQGALSFAAMVHKDCPVLLTGIFLPKVDYARFFFFPSAFAAPAYIPIHEDVEEAAIEKNVHDFEALCEKNNISCKVHKDLYDYALPQLTKETRFADLMIIGSEVFYTVGSDGPLEYLKDALHNTECPVVIVPEKFNAPGQIILAYDGSASSVYAIKQFINLFPSLCVLPATLVYAGDEKHNIPEELLIEELLSCHFKDLAITKIAGEQKKHFHDWLASQSNPLLVSGSFSRSGISELFSKGFVIDTIRQHKTPVFIAHQ